MSPTLPYSRLLTSLIVGHRISLCFLFSCVCLVAFSPRLFFPLLSLVLYLLLAYLITLISKLLQTAQTPTSSSRD
ncbi:hypothetical protein BC827DRAFT_1207475 [Russula dissimulans]|nr:hypothetical protein BC827DRAFT_1207475 [Russula dissimulans]